MNSYDDTHTTPELIASGHGWALYRWCCPTCVFALQGFTPQSIEPGIHDHIAAHAATFTNPVREQAKCPYCNRTINVWPTGSLKGLVKSHDKRNGGRCPGSLRKALELETA